LTTARAERRAFAIVAATAACWIAALAVTLRPLHWDELEFYRAARWIGEGRVPFRDFWEHHTPLQWFLFAPVARFASPLAVRIAQLPLWVAMFALLRTMMRRAGVPPFGAAIAMLLPLSSRLFVQYGVEFRVDVLGNLCFLGGLACALRRPASLRAWIAFGALLSAAVLANVRMAPLIVAAGALAMFVRTDERRWRWNGRGAAMGIGIVAVVGAAAAYVSATNAWRGVEDGLIRYNRVSDTLMAGLAHNLGATLLVPVRSFDVATFALVAAAVAASVALIRTIRSPGELHVIAILALVAAAAFARLGVHYPYHLQTFLLLATPLAATVVARWPRPTMAVVAVAMMINIALLTRSSAGAALHDQRALQRQISDVSHVDDVVWDAVGYSDRHVAYRCWFMPAGVRVMAERGLLPPYGAPELLASPPAAIVFTARVAYWLESFPELVPVIRAGYVPLQRHLWIPALSGVVGPAAPSREWRVLRSGRYRIWAGEVLARHPWFRDPLRWDMASAARGDELIVPLAQIPPVDDAALQWTVNGRAVRGPVVDLAAGDRVRVDAAVAAPVGIFVVPESVTTLFHPSLAEAGE